MRIPHLKNPRNTNKHIVYGWRDTHDDEADYHLDVPYVIE
jgi:hypothetical protein